MPHQLPSMGVCFFICALSLIAPSLGGDYVAPPSGDYVAPPSGDYIAPPSGDYVAPPSGDYVAPPSGGYVAPPSGGYPSGTNTKCCDNSVLINGRCVCKPNYYGASKHPCVQPCWDKCGKNTYCDVKSFLCYCKKGFIGKPYVNCYLPCYGKCVVDAYCNKETNKCVCNTGLVGDGTAKCTKPSVIVLAQSSYAVSESVGQLKIEVLRQGSSDGILVVKFKSTDLTAIWGVDFSPNQGEVIFYNGETTKYITYYIIADQDYEPDEKFKVTLVSVSVGGVLGNLIEAVVTITNDDKPCGGLCRPYSHCDVPSQKCICNDGYILDPYHGGCGKPCGGRCCANAYCNKRDNRCYCNTGYYGLPTVNCYKPCKGACKANAYCGKYNKCQCNKGFYGNPYEDCYPPCHGRCKTNARCDIPSQRCVCNTGFFGDPYKICNKPGVVVIDSATYSVNEDATVVVINVTRTGSTFVGVTVSWVSHDITAVEGSDYDGTAGSIYFGSQDTSKTITIQITDDTKYEKDETFSVVLTHVTQGAVLGGLIQTIVTIKDDDAPCGGPCKPFSRCDLPSQKCVCIKGYIPNPYGGCSLPCGGKCCTNAYCDSHDNQCKCKTGYIGYATVKCSKPCDDACRNFAYCAKNNRCYCKTGYYGNPYRGCHLPCYNLCKAYSRCSTSTHTCHCHDGYYGDPLKGCTKPAHFAFTKSAHIVKENVGSVQITMSRVGSSSQGVTVYWKTTDGSAKHGTDFGSTGGTIYFASGQTTKNITISIINDQVYETEESFTVVLSFVSTGGQLGSLVTATVTIQDDDVPCGGPCGHYAHCDLPSKKCVCDVGYLLDSYYGGCVRPCGGRCCANAYCDSRDNTCKCKSGYKGIGTVGCFKPCKDACKQNAYCGIDNRCCCNKGYYGNPYKGCTPPCKGLCKQNARCDIHSQRCECLQGFVGDPLAGCGKPGLIVFAKPTYSVNEDAGSITVTVNRVGSTYGFVSVTWTTMDGSAVQSDDFFNSGGVIFFGHGVSSRTITISIVVDQEFELDEKFQVRLIKVTGSGASLGTLSTTIVTIVNDDKPCGGPCGINSYCDNTSQKCLCKKGFILWHGVCGIPCGGKCCANSYCGIKDNQCHCKSGYIGIPTQKCYIPCNKACKAYAFCGEDNKCRCKTGYYGNPYENCHLPCHDQCKTNSKCDITSQRCVCFPGFFGNPIKEGCQKPSKFVIGQSSYAVQESVNLLVIYVNRIGSSFGSVKVTWVAKDSTAVHGHDYVNTGGVLYFGSNEMSKTISIHIIDDSVHESDEQFFVELTHVTEGGVLGTQYKATVTIENDDERCGGKCVFNAYCNHADNKCYCNKGLVGNGAVKCDPPCGGHCGAYPHSHCNNKTNTCACDDMYSGDPYHGGCVCDGGHGGDTGGYPVSGGGGYDDTIHTNTGY